MMQEEEMCEPSELMESFYCDPLQVSCLESAEATVTSSLKFKKRLISHVRRRGELYDPTHKGFSDITTKDKAWEKIAKSLNSKVEICKNTWVDLRQQYQRYVRKLRKYLLYGNKNRKTRPIMALETELLFLWRFIPDRNTCRIPYLKFEKEKPKTVEEDDEVVIVEPESVVIIVDDEEKFDKPISFMVGGVEITQKIRLLLELIESYPELYDCDHKYFNDYRRKGIIWNSIANESFDKATKLMKLWIQLQTRLEWELKKNKNPIKNQQRDIRYIMRFLKPYILKNPYTIYKQSYYLKIAWYEPLDSFKNIFNLLANLKKFAKTLHELEKQINEAKNNAYTTFWMEMGKVRNCPAGQMEATWLTLRFFYIELMKMRQQNYQLQDKWYFESTITELYAMGKAQADNKENPPTSTTTTNNLATTTSVTTMPIPTPAVTTPDLRMPQIISAKSLATAATIVPKLPNTNSGLKIVPISSTISTTSANIIPTNVNSAPLPTAMQSLPKQSGTFPLPQIANVQTLNISSSSSSSPNLSSPSLIPTNVIPVSGPISANPMSPFATQILPTTFTAWPGEASNASMGMLPNLGVLSPSTSVQPSLEPLNQSSQAQIQPSQTILQVSQPLIQSSQPLVQTSQSPIQTFKPLIQPSQAQVQPPQPLVQPTQAPVQPPQPASTTNTEGNRQNSIAFQLLSSLPGGLRSNEIIIELIATRTANQLIVAGPSLPDKITLSMETTARFIREVMALPLLHNKNHSQFTRVQAFWVYISKKFRLPTHICRAIWNFLSVNFEHFSKIAPLEELMKPFQTDAPDAWHESTELFTKFSEIYGQKKWVHYEQKLPELMKRISREPLLFHDLSRKADIKIVQNDEIIKKIWEDMHQKLRMLMAEEIWSGFRSVFWQYMHELELGYENHWPLRLWPILSKMDFLIKQRYSKMEPFYYIVQNKFNEEVERCAKLALLETERQQPQSQAPKIIQRPESSLLQASYDIDAFNLLAAIRRYPKIYQKATAVEKAEAWRKVAEELNASVTACRASFQRAIRSYRSYMLRDPKNHCKLNQRYYMNLHAIYRSMKSTQKLSIKTPTEVNQSVDTDNMDEDGFIPDRMIFSINMDNCTPALVAKNWAYGLANFKFTRVAIKLEKIFSKYSSLANDDSEDSTPT